MSIDDDDDDVVHFKLTEVSHQEIKTRYRISSLKSKNFEIDFYKMKTTNSTTTTTTTMFNILK
jgi:hypothetical protein